MLRSILCGADGVVVSSHRLLTPIGLDKRLLETTTPSALNKERDLFSLWRSHPSFAKEGYTRRHNHRHQKPTPCVTSKPMRPETQFGQLCSLVDQCTPFSEMPWCSHPDVWRRK